MKRKFFMGLAALIAMIVLVSIGCGIKVLKENPKNDPKGDPGDALETTINIPQPDSLNQVDWECGTYYSDISAKQIEAYLQKLKEDGWKSLDGTEMIFQVAKGVSLFQFYKENCLLQMIIRIEDRENAMVNSILVRQDQDISIEEVRDLQNETTLDEAMTKIQSNVDDLVKEKLIPTARGNIIGIFEIFIDNAYEKMGIQAYAAVSEYGFSGCFLIHQGITSYVEGNLENACIADIDTDGAYELVDLFSDWNKGIQRINMIAYEYTAPDMLGLRIELLQRKYENCFVPKSGYEVLKLKKEDETTIRVIDEAKDYGKLRAEGSSLQVEDGEAFPFEVWSTSYDQKLLLDFDKVMPETPPEVVISVDRLSLDYIVQEGELTIADAFKEIKAREQFIPTFHLGGFSMMEVSKRIRINFGNSIPDSILVYDAMLNENGSVRYGEKHIEEQAVKILDSSNIEFNLKQQMSYYLSSNMEDYERDWYRLFRVVCRWGEMEATYAFLVNTGNYEKLTEIEDQEFLICEGTYSALSSSWGIGFSVDLAKLPKQYVIEWRVSDGIIKTWSEAVTKPMGILTQHNGYPMTSSEDENQGAVIWTPLSFEDTQDVTIEAYIYESAEDKSPIAYSKVTLKNNDGLYQKK